MYPYIVTDIFFILNGLLTFEWLKNSIVYIQTNDDSLIYA